MASSGAMQADHQHTSRTTLELKFRIGAAKEFDEFVMDDFDDLLAGMNALDDFLADGFAFDAFDEIASDLEIDVGVQQRQPHFPQRVGRICLRDPSQSAQVAKRVLKLAADRVEHPIKLGYTRKSASREAETERKGRIKGIV